MYEKGTGVPQDDKEAVKWWKLVAKQGLAEAQFHLGLMQLGKLGVTQDYQEDTEDHKEAEKWMRLSAEQEHERAQFNLDNYA
jgi:hypothetical protein